MPTMIPPECYVREALGSLLPLDAVITPLHAAHGLVLAEDVTAALPVPPWTNSAMDGYALRAEDAAGATDQEPVVLPVAGDVPAGTAPAPLAPGTAMRIMTGAMLPEGADAVVRVEDTDQAPGPRPLPQRVAIHAAPSTCLNVRRAGEGCAVGDPVMEAGTLLGATAISALASVGRAEVLARPRPRVAVVSTGAELVDAGQGLAHCEGNGRTGEHHGTGRGLRGAAKAEHGLELCGVLGIAHLESDEIRTCHRHGRGLLLVNVCQCSDICSPQYVRMLT